MLRVSRRIGLWRRKSPVALVQENRYLVPVNGSCYVDGGKVRMAVFVEIANHQRSRGCRRTACHRRQEGAISHSRENFNAARRRAACNGHREIHYPIAIKVCCGHGSRRGVLVNGREIVCRNCVRYRSRWSRRSTNIGTRSPSPDLQGHPG